MPAQPVSSLFTPELTARIIKMLKDKPESGEFKHSRFVSSVEHAEEMGWHVYGCKPVKLLEKTRPREDAEVRQYRLESYQPITKPYCKKALKIVYKIFSPNLYSIRFKEGVDDFVKYTTQEYPLHRSVVNLLADFVLKKMIADPNGIILVEPSDYTITSLQRVAPIVTVYESCKVHLIDEKTFKYVLLYDKKIERQDASGGTDYYYTWVTEQAIQKVIFRITKQDGLETVLTDEYLLNGFKKLPFWYLGGEFSEGEKRWYDSFFYDAVPFWNKAIDEDSDVDGAYRMHMFPQKWEVTDECEYVEDSLYPCNGGYIFNQEKGSKYKCPSCKGSGFKTAKGPYDIHLVNRDKFLGSADGVAGTQIPFGYVTVPTDATKMLEEKVERNLKEGLKALNMDIVEEIGLNQSGKAKELDRTELNNFLQKVADFCFDIHLKNIFYHFAQFMFMGKTDVAPEISKPTQFDIYTASELTESLEKAKTARLDSAYIRTKQKELQIREFQTNPELLAKLNLAIDLDPFSQKDRAEISAMLNDNTITMEALVIHDNIFSFVDRALLEDRNFADKPKEQQSAVLIKYAGEIIAANKKKIDAAEQMLKDATGGAGK